jgi:octopamine receptor
MPASLERKRLSGTRRNEKVKISVSYPSTEHIVSPTSMSNSSSIQASMISSSSKEPIASKNSNDFHNSMNIFRDQMQMQRSNEYSPNSTKKPGKRSIKKIQVKKFKMETKAAKTLALVVGLFICCWLPFFTIYLIRPFCDNCINSMLFSIAFWIGYCNSAINPMIYALFSKEFRLGFKRVIYRCFCSKKYWEENKFYVLHRFVPFPFVPPNQNNSILNMDFAR